MVRISIRQQLAVLLILFSGIGMAILAIVTWHFTYQVVVDSSSETLKFSAVFRAAQIAGNMDLIQTAATFVTTRDVLQTALAKHNNGTVPDWDLVARDLNQTLGEVGPITVPIVLQAQVFARNSSAPTGVQSVINSTGYGADAIVLPYASPDGGLVRLGDPGFGFPPDLYPNLTIADRNGKANNTVSVANTYKQIGSRDTLVLGPEYVNQSFSLLSMTLPIVNASSHDDVLGWVTVLASSSLISAVLADSIGLGTGQALLYGPNDTSNEFAPEVVNTPAAERVFVALQLPANASASLGHQGEVSWDPPFRVDAYPILADCLENCPRNGNTVLTELATTNEKGANIAASVAWVPIDLVDWLVVVERPHDEVWSPIDWVRTIILVCLFSFFGFLMFISFPLAHLAVRPLLRLRQATEGSFEATDDADGTEGSRGSSSLLEKPWPSLKKRWTAILLPWMPGRQRRKATLAYHLDPEKHSSGLKHSRVPAEVPLARWYIEDEMIDLIRKFNEMSRELRTQYDDLEDRVRQRTAELEVSKKAAEAANESKTIFLANVSHELKTPLNGILGLCAVSMEEEDPQKVKESLGVISKSGELLYRTLSDLLTFSTNQVGYQKVTLEEKEFDIRDLESQTLAIFGEQAKDRKIRLEVNFETSHLANMTVCGDLHRILQVIINLVSNSLKFTPEHGSVTVKIGRLSSHSLESVSDLKYSRSLSVNGTSDVIGTANFIAPENTRIRNSVAETTSAPKEDDLWIRIQIQDTGPGISKESQGRIFEPFVQGDVGLNRKHSGTGLGLSICSQLATLMRGSISVSSELGQGSTFTVDIPLRHMATRKDGQTWLGSLQTDSLESALTRSHSVDTPGSPKANPSDSALIKHRPVSMVREVSKDDTSAVATQSTAVAAVPPYSPSPRQSPSKPPPPKAVKPNYDHIRVLVAEDNKVNQEVILRMLKLEGATNTTLADNGQIAFDLVSAAAAATITPTTTSSSSTSPSSTSPSTFSSSSSAPQSSPFDLIFMDIQMPELDGIQSTKQIRAHGVDTPIIALTAFAEQSNMDECYACGMNYFLAKPVKRPLLREVLAQYCTRRRDEGDGSEEDKTGAG